MFPLEKRGQIIDKRFMAKHGTKIYQRETISAYKDQLR